MPAKRTVKAAPLRAPETPIQSPAHIPPVPPVAAVPALPEPFIPPQPGPPTDTGVPPYDPLGVIPAEIARLQAAEASLPAKIRIRTRYKYPIYVPHLDRLVRPDETAELDDHPWLRRQIELNTFILL
jgi:hypothetical protein